jgi:hypothetical protein
MHAYSLTSLNTITGALLIGSLAAGPAFGATAAVSVGGKASPYLAGMPDGSTCCSTDSAPAESPVQVGGFALAPGMVLTFGVTGSVSNDLNKPPTDPPDGSVFFISPFTGQPGTPAANGIAAINAPVNALVGVFLDDHEPTSSATPAELDFSAGGLGMGFTTLCPALKQVFFIGDGLTGSGTGAIQQFVVPAGATRLFLGTVDGFDWNTNSGAFSVQINSVTPGAAGLAAAVLPGSRSVQVGATATVFGTVVNAGPNVAVNCRISPNTPLTASFAFQTTDSATNAVTGTANRAAACVLPGAGQSYVIAFSPTAEFAPTDVSLRFECDNGAPAPVISGLDTLLLSASATPVPDIVALSATINHDGIVDVVGGAGVFSVATVNLGAGAAITASADTGGASLPIGLAICQTDPGSGACMSTPADSVTTQIDTGATPTFGVFVSGNGPVSFNPAVNRVVVRFKDGGGLTRGATSVAVRTQ